MTDVIDHRVVGRSRVATQYLESPKFLGFIDALADHAQSIETVLQSLYMLPDIDAMTGANLDTIGEIVGIGRAVQYPVSGIFFGFDGQTEARVFGEEGIPGIGARFREEGEIEFETNYLSDVEYRLLIRAKIVKNHSKGTCEDILNGLTYLFNAPTAVVEDLGSMQIGLAIGRAITAQEKGIIGLLDILPRPAGVLISWRETYDATRYFGFSEQPGAKTFSEEGVASSGGFFAEEF